MESGCNELRDGFALVGYKRKTTEQCISSNNYLSPLQKVRKQYDSKDRSNPQIDGDQPVKESGSGLAEAGERAHAPRAIADYDTADSE